MIFHILLAATLRIKSWTFSTKKFSPGRTTSVYVNVVDEDLNPLKLFISKTSLVANEIKVFECSAILSILSMVSNLLKQILFTLKLVV